MGCAVPHFSPISVALLPGDLTRDRKRKPVFLIVGRSKRDTPVESDPVVEQHHLFKVIEKKLAYAFAVGAQFELGARRTAELYDSTIDQFSLA
jgi:hypothetical protein